MSVLTAAGERRATWLAEFDLFGYAAEAVWLNAQMTAFEIRAVRPDSYAAPQVTIDIDEVWIDGADPINGVNRSLHGAYLMAARVHAQIEPGEEGAHRVDVGDPRKPPPLTIHLHPFGQPNHKREPLPAMPVPEQWLHQVETIAAQVAAGLPPAM